MLSGFGQVETVVPDSVSDNPLTWMTCHDEFKQADGAPPVQAAGRMDAIMSNFPKDDALRHGQPGEAWELRDLEQRMKREAKQQQQLREAEQQMERHEAQQQQLRETEQQMERWEAQQQQQREERDALLELQREKEEREKAESAAAMARTRSASKAAELAAAKAELARLQSMQGGGGGRMW